MGGQHGLDDTPTAPDSHRLDSQFRSLFEAAPDAILIVDRSGRIVLVNEQAEQLFGYHRLELHGRLIELLIPERYRQQHVTHRDDYVAAPRRRPMGSGLALSGLRKDGTEVPVEISLSPFDAAAGDQVIAVVRDVTERRDAELVLAERTARLEEQAQLIDLANSAILVVNYPHDEITFWNGGAEALYGWSREEAIGRCSYELLHTEFSQPLEEIQEILATDERWRGELRQTCKDGRQVIVASQWSVRRDAAGRPVAYLKLNTDVTARRRAEAELRQTAEELARSNSELMRLTDELARSNSELEQFTHVASHDLQEPLRMVSSYTQLLARRYSGRLDEDADEFIAYAVDGANRMQGLIEDLLAYARVGSRGRELEPVDLQAIVTQLLESMSATLADSGGRVQVGELPMVMADPTQIRQLFQNLIGNAVKYRRDEPLLVEVSAELQDGDWTFRVRDNGIGFESQYAEQVFSMFKRLHTRVEYEGTGIGLAICKKIVDRHGGNIWAESEPGQGSTFAFTIPGQRP
jgi:PAS domain S-box-containing protein